MAESTPPLTDLVSRFAEGTMVLMRKPRQDEPQQRKMEPDRTYIAVLPGHSRPAFVRKPRHYTANPFGLTAIARALAPAPRRRRSYSVEQVVRARSPSPTYIRAYAPPPPLLHYRTSSQPTVLTQGPVHTYPRSIQYSPPALERQMVSDSITTKVTTYNGRAEESTLHHTCSSCGKYRSASYQSRHPLTRGELPRSGICRRCIRNHTSSEDSEEEARRLRRIYGYDKGHKRYQRRWKRYRNDTDSTATYITSFPSKEEIRTVHETRSVSRGRDRSRTASTDSTRFGVTIEPGQLRTSRRRRLIEPVKVVECTRYVEQREQSRSRSHGSSQSDYEQPVMARVRRDDYGQRIRRTVPESYRPPMARTIEYGYDGDHTRETSSIRPAIRRSSASSLVQYTTPYRVEEEDVIESRERSYSPRITVCRRDTEETYASRPFRRRFRRQPTNSVRVLRVCRDNEDEAETCRTEMPALERRVSFIAERPRLRSSTQKQLVEAEEAAIVYRRQGVCDTELETTDEVSFRSFPSAAPRNSTFQPQRDRLLPTGDRDEEYELVRDFERARITPSRKYIQPPAPIPRRTDHYHTSHHERFIGGSADEESRRYCDVLDRAVFYRDV